MKNDCINAGKVERKSVEFLTTKADSVSAIRKNAWKEKTELEKQGIIVDIDFSSDIYFDQNCFTTDNLDIAYLAIGTMIRNKNLKIRIVGNLDKLELKNNPELSLKRAEFIRDIMVKNGIEESRIEILDVKSDRPYAQQSKNGRKENRRTDFEIINE